MLVDEPGCLAYQPYLDPDDPARMVIVEERTHPQALAEHRPDRLTEHWRGWASRAPAGDRAVRMV